MPGRDADAGFDGLIEQGFGVDIAGQFEPQHGAADRLGRARIRGKMLCNQRCHPLGILLQYRPQRLEMPVVVTGSEIVGQGELLQQTGGAGKRPFELGDPVDIRLRHHPADAVPGRGGLRERAAGNDSRASAEKLRGNRPDTIEP